MVEGGQVDATAEEGLWQGLLHNASRRASPQNSRIIFLGDASAGKTSLLERFHEAMRDNDDSLDDELTQESHGRPLLSYSFFEAVDPAAPADADDAPARVDVWSLSDVSFKDLLSVALSDVDGPQGLSRTLCIIALDLSRPWTFEKALERWMKVLSDVLGARLKAMPPSDRALVAGRQAAYLARCYSGLRDDEESGFSIKAGGANGDGAAVELPPGVLEVDVGVPLVVVGLKADVVKTHNFEEEQRSQFMQQFLRSFCLRHGAALAYTSAHTDINRLLLQRYLLHRLYPESFSFSLKGQASMRKEDLFVPAGWDSAELISALASAKVPWSPNASYNEVIVPPKPERDQADDADDPALAAGQEGPSFVNHGAWLLELQQQLDALGAAPVPEPRASITYTQRKEPEPVITTNKPTPAPDAKAPPASKDKEQIRNFFEGLLSGPAKK